MITCSCCGNWIEDNEAENAYFGQVPYPDDNGFGMCLDCGGDKNSDDVKKQMGWGTRMFCEARFDLIRKNLNSKNCEKWDKTTYEKKVLVVMGLVEKGAII